MIKKTFFIILLLYLPYQTNAQCWAKVSARYLHTLAIKTDGTLWAWGRNDNGQLGIGNTIDKNVPTQVGTDTDWKEIDSGVNYQSLTRSKEVQDLIQTELDRVNKKFARVEQIKKFFLLETQLSAEDEELTPTMKLKRKLVEKKYSPQIEAMYRG